MLTFLVLMNLLNIPLALMGLISFIILQRKSFLTSRTMKSSNEQRLTCGIHYTNRLQGILSVIKYILQKSIVYGKLTWAFVQDVAKENDGMNYLFVVIDVFSKFLWVRPMKKETVRSLIQAVGSILSKKRKPEKPRTDKGTEFVNKSFQQYLKKQRIQFYTAKNEPKADVVERVNRTLKSKLYRYFTGVNSLHYIDVLQDIVDSYNNTYHRSIGWVPATVSLLNVGQVRRKLYGKIERSNQNASSLK